MGDIKLMAERRDFVNCLGMRLYNVDFHVGRRGDPDPDHVYGQPLPYFHCPDSCRDKSGELGPQTSEGGVSKVINGFTAYFLTNPKYKDSMYDISIDLILLMMTNKKYIPDSEHQSGAADKISEAIKELTVVFCEMIAEQKNFRNDIVELFFSETDLMLATIAMVEGDEADTAAIDESSIGTLYVRALKREFIENPAFRKDFITTLRYMSKLVRKMVHENNPKTNILVKYINRSINKLIKEFTVKAVEKIAGEFFMVLRDILF